MKFFRNQIGLCFNSKLIITLFHQLSIAFVCCTTPCYLLSLFVIYWHSLYHSLSFALPIVAIRFQLLRFVVPLVVTRCRSMYQSSSFQYIFCLLIRFFVFVLCFTKRCMKSFFHFAFRIIVLKMRGLCSRLFFC